MIIFVSLTQTSSTSGVLSGDVRIFSFQTSFFFFFFFEIVQKFF